MSRLNFILLFALVGCALALVTAQHEARQLFIQLQQAQDKARQLDIEWGQLQLEQRTWATHGRIEKIAGQSLHMRNAEASRTRVIRVVPDPNYRPGS
jgi:cell division protein FtsL